MRPSALVDVDLPNIELIANNTISTTAYFSVACGKPRSYSWFHFINKVELFVRTWKRNNFVPYFDTFIRQEQTSQITKFMGPTWGPSGADRTQMGPMLAAWTLLPGIANNQPKVIPSFINGANEKKQFGAGATNHTMRRIKLTEVLFQFVPHNIYMVLMCSISGAYEYDFLEDNCGILPHILRCCITGIIVFLHSTPPTIR